MVVRLPCAAAALSRSRNVASSRAPQSRADQMVCVHHLLGERRAAQTIEFQDWGELGLHRLAEQAGGFDAVMATALHRSASAA